MHSTPEHRQTSAPAPTQLELQLCDQDDATAIGFAGDPGVQEPLDAGSDAACALDTTQDQQVDFITGTPTTSQRAARYARHLDSMKDVIDITALIEAVLEGDFGGRGRGIHSRLDSLERPIPASLDKKLRYLAAVRNKALVEPWWPIPNRPRYLHDCEEAAAWLLEIANRRQRTRGRFTQILLKTSHAASRCMRRILQRSNVRHPLLAIATLAALSAVLVILSSGDAIAHMTVLLR